MWDHSAQKQFKRGPANKNIWPPRGEPFAPYLVLTGAARYLAEFIRINPRSFFGMTNAQAASLAS